MRVAIYCRLSREDDDKLHENDESESIQNQKSMLINYAIERSWDIYNIYCDEDYSGIDSERPEFNKLLEDAKNHKFDIVLCKTQSRFTRDMEMVEKYLHNKFVEWNIRFVSLVDHVDTLDKGNKKSRQINGLVNEWYLEDLSENIRRTFDSKRQQGLHIGSFVCYGYKRSPENKNKLVIDEESSDVIRLIFNLYEQGNGITKIAQILNDKGILTPTKYKQSQGINFKNQGKNIDYWCESTVSKILKNEVYIGNLVQGKTTYVSYKNHKPMKVPKKDWIRIENAHEPIIDMETWNKVQSILGTHYKVTKTGQINYFTRKVYCSCCDKAFMRNVYSVKSEKTGKRAYLQCKGNKKFHICPNNKAIRMDSLEEILLNAINDLLDNYYDKNNLKELYENRQEQDTNNNDSIKALIKEKEDLNKKISNNKTYYRNLFEEKVKGVISEDMFQMMSKDYFNEIENMMKRIEIIDKQIDELKVEKKEKKNADSILKKYKNIKELNKIILDEFIDKVYIGEYDKENKTRDVEIEWNFEF